MKANCLLYALRQWQPGNPASQLLVRRSRWGRFPHFAVLTEQADGSLIKREYIPLKPRPHGLPPLLFRGEEKTTVYVPVGESAKHGKR